MAKKEIKKQTIEEILAEHTPTSDAVKSAVQRYNEEKKKQQEQIIINTRLHYLGPCGQPSQDPCRRETSSAVSRRRGQGCLSSRSRSGGSGPGISLSRYIE